MNGRQSSLLILFCLTRVFTAYSNHSEQQTVTSSQSSLPSTTITTASLPTTRESVPQTALALETTVVDVIIGSSIDPSRGRLLVRLATGKWVTLCNVTLTASQASFLCLLAGVRDTTKPLPAVVLATSYSFFQSSVANSSQAYESYSTVTVDSTLFGEVSCSLSALICTISNAQVTLATCPVTQETRISCAAGTIDLLPPTPKYTLSPSQPEYLARFWVTNLASVDLVCPVSSSYPTPTRPSEIIFGRPNGLVPQPPYCSLQDGYDPRSCPGAESRLFTVPAGSTVALQFEVRFFLLSNPCPFNDFLQSSPPTVELTLESSKQGSHTPESTVTLVKVLGSKPSSHAGPSSNVLSSWTYYSVTISPRPFGRQIKFRFEQTPTNRTDWPLAWSLKNTKLYATSLSSAYISIPSTGGSLHGPWPGLIVCESYIIGSYNNLTTDGCLALCSKVSTCRSVITPSTASLSSSKIIECTLLSSLTNERQDFCNTTARALTLAQGSYTAYQHPLSCSLTYNRSVTPCLEAHAGGHCTLSCLPGYVLSNTGRPTASHSDLVCDSLSLTWLPVDSNFVFPICIPRTTQWIIPQFHLAPTINVGVLGVSNTNVNHSSVVASSEVIVASQWSAQNSGVACKSLGFDSSTPIISALYPLLQPTFRLTFGAEFPSRNASLVADYICSGSEVDLKSCLSGSQPQSLPASSIELSCHGVLRASLNGLLPAALFSAVSGVGSSCVISASTSLFFGGEAQRHLITRPFRVPALIRSGVVYDFWFGAGSPCDLPEGGEEVSIEYRDYDTATNTNTSDWTLLEHVQANRWNPSQGGWETRTLILPASLTSRVLQIRWRQRIHSELGKDVWGLSNIRLELPLANIRAHFVGTDIAFGSLVLTDWIIAVSPIESTQPSSDGIESCLSLCALTPHCQNVLLGLNFDHIVSSCMLLRSFESISFFSSTLSSAQRLTPTLNISSYRLQTMVGLCVSLDNCPTQRQGAVCVLEDGAAYICTQDFVWRPYSLTTNLSIGETSSPAASSAHTITITIIVLGVIIVVLICFAALGRVRRTAAKARRIPSPLPHLFVTAPSLTTVIQSSNSARNTTTGLERSLHGSRAPSVNGSIDVELHTTAGQSGSSLQSDSCSGQVDSYTDVDEPVRRASVAIVSESILRYIAHMTTTDLSDCENEEEGSDTIDSHYHFHTIPSTNDGSNDTVSLSLVSDSVPTHTSLLGAPPTYARPLLRLPVAHANESHQHEEAEISLV